jgi:hypothetical protein
MPEIGTSGLMSGDGKRGDGQRPQATAPILDSTKLDVEARLFSIARKPETHLFSTEACSMALL